MKRVRKHHSLMTEINIIPLTDVILVLLMIFMVATPLISQNRVEIKLPVSASEEAIENSQQVYITITGEEVIYLENKLLTKQELRQRMTALVKKNSDLKVIMAADKSCRFQNVIGVMDILKEVGVKSLNIATRTDQSY